MTDSIIDISRGALNVSDARVKVMMNNIVNSQTPGFKKTDFTVKSFPLLLQDATARLEDQSAISSMVPQVDKVYQSQEHGAYFKTGNSTDIAIGGDGYFVLEGKDGELYTRDGRCKLDGDGRLVSVSGGYPVLGQGGPIVVIPGSKLEISQSGDVIVDDIKVDKMRLVVFDDPGKLESVNNILFKVPPQSDVAYKEEANPRLIQGFVEASNVSIMDEYVNMVSLNRIFDADTKIVETRDQALAKAITMGQPAQ